MLRVSNTLISINANISKTKRTTYKMFIIRIVELGTLNNTCRNNFSMYLQIKKLEAENRATPTAEAF